MEKNRNLAKTAGMISGLTMISRIGGYIRDGLGGALLGAGLANDAYLAAFRIPNLLRDLFAEGALSSAFIPTFTEVAIKQGQARAWRLVSIVVNVILLAMLVIIGLGELYAPALVKVLVPGFAQIPQKLTLTIHLTRIVFPFLAFVSLAAVMMGILNSNERFGLPALAPVMFNLSMIVMGIVIFTFADSAPERLVVWWTWGTVIGGLLQMAVQVPAVCALGYRWRPVIDWQDPGLRRIFKLMGPAVLGLSVTQINLLINTLIASFLPQGSVTYLYYGNRLMQLPLGVFGVAIATALLPLSSAQLARGEQDKFIETLSFGLRLLFIIILPSAVGLIVLAEPINRLLFQYGRFDAQAVQAVARASMLYTLGLVAYAAVKVIVPTFYALGDSRTPLRAAVMTMTLGTILNVLLMGPLGYKGLALATAVSGYFNFAFLTVRLRKRLGRMDGRRILNSLLRVCLASAGMGLLVWLANAWWPEACASRWWLAGRVFALISFGTAAYAGFGWLCRIPEQGRIWALVKAKVGLKGAGEPWVE